MYIPETRRRSALPASPGTASTRPRALPPDDLPHGEESDFAMNGIIECMHRNVGFATQVGDIDYIPPTRTQHAVDFAGGTLDKPKIIVQTQVIVIVLTHVIWRRCESQCYAIVRKFTHVRRGGAVNTVGPAIRVRYDGLSEIYVLLNLVQPLVEIAVIEGGGIVGFAFRCSERRC